MRVVGRFDDVVFASGDVAPELVANYVRQRVIASHVETGPAKTVFTGVTLRVNPVRTLRVDVISRNGDTGLTVRDETRPPAREGLTEAERWKSSASAPRARRSIPRTSSDVISEASSPVDFGAHPG